MRSEREGALERLKISSPEHRSRDSWQLDDLRAKWEIRMNDRKEKTKRKLSGVLMPRLI